MAGKQTSWYDDLLMAASRRSNDLVGVAADLADRYGLTPANTAAWLAQHVGGYSPEEAARIRRNLGKLGSNRDILNAGASANETRFRQAGGKGARKAEDVMAPVRLGAATYKPAAIPQAVVRETPGALRAVGRYLETSTPSGVMSDIGNLMRSGYEGVKEDPYGAVVNTLMYASPQTILAASPFDYAAMRETSEILDPYVKDNQEAANAQGMVDALSIMPTLAVVPGARSVARKVRRKRGGSVNKKGKK